MKMQNVKCFKMAPAVCIRHLFCFYLLLALLEFVHAPLPKYTPAMTSFKSSRHALIKAYFKQGYSYKEIILFLSVMHGLSIGMTTLKKALARMGLRRRKQQTEGSLGIIIKAVKKKIASSGIYEFIIN